MRLRSDVPVGSCLSGGLDSSAIVTTASKNKVSSLSPTTISSCYTDPKYDEQEYIDEVIEAVNFKSIKIFPDINDLARKDLLEHIIYHQDQPIKSASHFSEYSVFEAAKKNELIVMLDGQGSDEFLAGYLPFRYFNLDLFVSGRVGKMTKELLCQKRNHFGWKALFLTNFKHFLKAFAPGLVSRVNQPAKWVGKVGREFVYDQWFDRTNFSNYYQNSINEIRYTSIPYQLHSEDRNSMAHSIESRLPFLDFELADFMLALPDEFKLGRGTTKRILRDSLKHTLPPKILNRHSKKGFEAPEKPFIDSNRNFIRDLLARAADSNPELINSSIVSDFDSYVSGTGSYQNDYFRVASFQVWFEKFRVTK